MSENAGFIFLVRPYFIEYLCFSFEDWGWWGFVVIMIVIVDVYLSNWGWVFGESI